LVWPALIFMIRGSAPDRGKPECVDDFAPAAACVLSSSATRSMCADSSRVAWMQRWTPGRIRQHWLK